MGEMGRKTGSALSQLYLFFCLLLLPPGKYDDILGETGRKTGSHDKQQRTGSLGRNKESIEWPVKVILGSWGEKYIDNLRTAHQLCAQQYLFFCLQLLPPGNPRRKLPKGNFSLHGIRAEDTPHLRFLLVASLSSQ